MVFAAVYLGRGWRLNLDPERGVCVKEFTQLNAVLEVYRYDLAECHIGPYPVPVTWQERKDTPRSGTFVSVIMAVAPFTALIGYVLGEELKDQVEVTQEFHGIIHYNAKSDIGSVLLIFKEPADCQRVLSAFSEVLSDQVSLS